MRKKTTEEFIAQAKEVHGDKYDYSCVQYEGMHTKVDLFCLEHGKFALTPTHHVHRRMGCVQCNCGIEAKTYTRDIYLRKVISLHAGKYQYTNLIFTSSKDLVVVTCPIHGDFKIRAGHHASGVGCCQCGRGTRKHSKLAIAWLAEVAARDGVEIRHAENGGEYKIPSTRYEVDGYCDSTNTVYEFYGDAWHGNPKKFSPDEVCHPRKAITAGELYHRTLTREDKIRSMGYQIVTIWESDWRGKS